MSTKLDVHDEFEKKLMAEIKRVQDTEAKLKSVLTRVDNKILEKGSFHNEGMIAGLSIALNMYRAEKSHGQ